MSPCFTKTTSTDARIQLTHCFGVTSCHWLDACLLAGNAPCGALEMFHAATSGVTSREGEFAMSRFDEDTSAMRMRIEATPIELRKPEMEPQSKARGILVGVILGALMWVAIIALGVAVWKWLS